MYSTLDPSRAQSTDAFVVPVGVLAHALRAFRRGGAAPYTPLPSGAPFTALAYAADPSAEPARIAARVADLQQRLASGDFELNGAAAAVGSAAAAAASAAAAAAAAPPPASARSDASRAEDSHADRYLAQSTAAKYRRFYNSEENILQGVAMGVLPAEAAASLMASLSGGGGGGRSDARDSRAGLGAS